MVKKPIVAPKRELLRETLLQIAERTIDEKGYQALRARALTDEAGCALGALYTVFPDMDALMIEVKLRILDQLDATMAAVTVEGAEAQLLALADTYLGFAVSCKRRWQTLFQHRLADEAIMPELYFQRLAEIFAHVEKPLAAILPLSSAAARASTGRALFAAVHGIVVLGLEQRLGQTDEQAIRVQFHILVQSAIAGLTQNARIADLANA